MNIGAIGWWDYDNQGDLAMLASLRQGLAPHRVVAITTGFPYHPDAIYRLNRLDFVLLGGGTLIPGKPTSPFDTFDHWGSQLECPMGVVGLGVDSIQEQFWPAVQALLGRARFFFVRDRVSRTLLHDHPKVKVAPDLTFAYPLPLTEASSESAATAPVCGVNLRRSASFDPTPWLAALAGLPVRLRGIPLSSFNVFNEGALLKQLDPEYPRCFNVDLYKQVDLVIGTAFHSVLFAVQAGLPVIAIDYAPKVRRFMEDIGLSRYLLLPDEHHRLSTLVAEVLEQHPVISNVLREIRSELREQAKLNLHVVREQIERSGPRHMRGGPRATIVVAGSKSAEKDLRTQIACEAQTYENVETLLVSADPQESFDFRLQHALTQSSGEYVTWIDGGDWLTEDAVDCLVSRLEQKPQCDVVYADYYSLGAGALPDGYHIVSGPEKLYRKDVVGPCFFLRRTLLTKLSQPGSDAKLLAYDLWLRARTTHVLIPFHALLFYSARQIGSPAFQKWEREVRRRWRQTQPVWARIVWNLIDSELGEKLVVQPLARIVRQLRWMRHAEPS